MYWSSGSEVSTNKFVISQTPTIVTIGNSSAKASARLRNPMTPIMEIDPTRCPWPFPRSSHKNECASRLDSRCIAIESTSDMPNRPYPYPSTSHGPVVAAALANYALVDKFGNDCNCLVKLALLIRGASCWDSATTAKFATKFLL